jgi:hypothetical protein
MTTTTNNARDAMLAHGSAAKWDAAKDEWALAGLEISSQQPCACGASGGHLRFINWVTRNKIKVCGGCAVALGLLDANCIVDAMHSIAVAPTNALKPEAVDLFYAFGLLTNAERTFLRRVDQANVSRRDLAKRGRIQIAILQRARVPIEQLI